MISCLMIINLRGDVLIYRDYKGDIRRSEANAFCSYLLSAKETENIPVQYHQGVSYMHIAQKDLFLIAGSKTNCNTATVFEYFYSFLEICRNYFNAELCDLVIRKNYVLIYELLDETIDYGIPQLTEADMLKEYIKEGGMDIKDLNDIDKLSQLTMQATGVNTWRPKEVYYKKNNIYIDVNEMCNVQFNSDGQVLRSDVEGAIEVKCQLSGMPECTFGLNDKLSLQRDMVGSRKEDQKAVLFKDLKFHRCVKLNKFSQERAITFVPPDGEFTLMNYIISNNIQIPFKIITFFNQNKDKVELKLKLKASFLKNFSATDIQMFIPVPSNILKINTSAGLGKAKLIPSQNEVAWRIKKIQGEKEALLRVYLTVQSDWNIVDWKKPPITVKFHIPTWTSSGVTVNFLKVIESSGYKVHKWIRYLTSSGEYSFRYK